MLFLKVHSFLQVFNLFIAGSSSRADHYLLFELQSAVNDPRPLMISKLDCK